MDSQVSLPHPLTSPAVSHLTQLGTLSSKASRMAQRYEEKGGDYIKEDGSKNEPKKGAPEPKDPGQCSG